VSVTYIPVAVRTRVAQQARNRCGYCHTSEEVTGAAMEIEHLVPESRGGSSTEANLWLACSECNSFKGDHVAAPDPTTNELVPLFNPRYQVWQEHFAWTSDGAHVVGLTASGRATVQALRLNRPLLTSARRIWVRAGAHPPGDDVPDEVPE
jgi:hypothetical protein